jgi:hypothetical protein
MGIGDTSPNPYLQSLIPFLFLSLQLIINKMKILYITDDEGKKVAVILPIKDYKRLIKKLKDLRANNKKRK